LALTPGTRLGPYEVIAPIGEGGMGQVYRARDTKLDRDVALKVLPESFVHDPDRLARFQREAKVLASLNHPNIAHIHGLEESDGVRALVMELVEGEDLAQRLTRGAIPLDEALPIAKQIAEALEAAHEQGIIHRDLKPANIKVREDGTVKVLDFGLAKAIEPRNAMPNATQSPTITTPAMTQAGVILGTAAYMSPEQVRGRAVDKRADIWAFGCVLYEALTGKRPFDGADAAETLANVIKDDPDWAALSSRVSSNIVAMVRACLEKDPRKRIASATVLHYVLNQSASPSSAGGRQSFRLSRLIVLSIASAVVGGIVGVELMRPRTAIAPSAAPLVGRFTINRGDGQSLTNTGRHVFALSSDGSRLAFTANSQIYLRRVGELDAVPIRGTENTGASEPFFSPDGEWVGFFSSNAIRKVQVAGGVPIEIGKAPQPFGASWIGDRILVGAGTGGIVELSVSGGPAKELIKARPDRNESMHGPQLLPDGHSVLFTLRTVGNEWNTAAIVVEDLASHKRQVLVEGGTDAKYLPTGHIVYGRDSALYAISFDPQRLQAKGMPTRIASGILEAGPGNTGAVQFAVSENGSFVYLPGTVGSRLLYWRGRESGESI
jgi:serine/threonine-protein kinase